MLRQRVAVSIVARPADRHYWMAASTRAAATARVIAIRPSISTVVVPHRPGQIAGSCGSTVVSAILGSADTLGQRLGQAIERFLRSRIGKWQPLGRRPPIDAMLTMCFFRPLAFHHRQEGAGDAHRSQIADVASSGGIDQHVDRRIVLRTSAVKARDARFRSRHRKSGRARRSSRRRPLERAAVDVGQDQLGPALGKCAGASLADSAACPRHQNAKIRAGPGSGARMDCQMYPQIAARRAS